MKCTVLKPIPGTGYSVGDEATFTEEGVEQFSEFLIDGDYIEIHKEEKAKAEDKPKK